MILWHNYQNGNNLEYRKCQQLETAGKTVDFINPC